MYSDLTAELSVQVQTRSPASAAEIFEVALRPLAIRPRWCSRVQRLVPGTQQQTSRLRILTGRVTSELQDRSEGYSQVIAHASSHKRKEVNLYPLR